MGQLFGDNPFKNREDVEAQVKNWAKIGDVLQFLTILFTVLGIIGDASDTTLGLDPSSWFLLAIVTGLLMISPFLRSALAKNLLGMEIIGKKYTIE